MRRSVFVTLTVSGVMGAALIGLKFNRNSIANETTSSLPIEENHGATTEDQRTLFFQKQEKHPSDLEKNIRATPSHAKKNKNLSPDDQPFVQDWLKKSEKFHDEFNSKIKAEKFDEAGDILDIYAYQEVTNEGGNYSVDDMKRHFDIINEYLVKYPQLWESEDLLNSSFQIAIQLGNKNIGQIAFKYIKEKNLDKFGCYEYSLKASYPETSLDNLSELIFSCAQDPKKGELYFSDHIANLLRKKEFTKVREDYALYKNRFKELLHVEKLISRIISKE